MSEATTTEDQAPATGKTRSPIERVLVWGGIVVLGGVVFMEYSAQKNYNAAMTWFQDNEARGKTLAEVREAAAGASETDVEKAAVQSASAEGAADERVVEIEKSFKWMSLFKQYQLVAAFQGEGDDAVFTGFYDVATMKQIEEEMAAKFDDQTVTEKPADLRVSSPGAPGGGGGGGRDEGEPDEDSGDEGASETEEPAQEDAPETEAADTEGDDK